MTDLDDQLCEWALWCRQGNVLAESYPGAWPLNDVWVPYKVGATAEERLEELEATTPANERVGQRMELWVNQLDAPQRVAIRVRHVYLPDGAFEGRDGYYRSNARAWETFGRLREMDHPINGINAETYETWLGEAMAFLRDIHQRWAEGV